MPRLRAETAEAHQRLEDMLDLPRRAAGRGWLLRLLERFHGFHSAWEPAVAERLPEALAFADRRRLGLLAADMQSLGRTDAEISALPTCLAARRLAETREAAMGSLYVLEGSTLGGQVIARALAGLEGLPDGGLRYFQPYGPRTGLMWRRLREGLEKETAGGSPSQVVAGAKAAFKVLHDWLEPVATPAA